MKITSFDIRDRTFRIDFTGLKGLDLLERTVSLVRTVAESSESLSISCALPDTAHTHASKHARALMRLNGIEEYALTAREKSYDDTGEVIIGKSSEFMMLRDKRNQFRYIMLLFPRKENAVIASICSYLVAAVLGFGSSDSFEVRLTVYELLMNIVEHGTEKPSDSWISLETEKVGDKISISIADGGADFDPTEKRSFDLSEYIRSRRRRGLGLILVQRLTEQITYSRKPGYNRILIEKSMPVENPGCKNEKEKIMTDFNVSDPEKIENGSYLITLHGYLDTSGSLLMEDLLNNLLQRNIKKVVLDFIDVSFISSAGVGILIGMVSSIREEGGEIKFKNITPKIRSVFRLLNLEDFFDIIEDKTLA